LRAKGKGGLVMFLILLAGVVLGGCIGHYLGQINGLEWLRYGMDFGFEDPVELEFGILILKFALQIKFNIAGIIGLVLAALFYKRL